MFAMEVKAAPRERISLNEHWHFCHGDPPDAGDKLSFQALKPWIKLSGSEFSKQPAENRPAGNPGADVSYVTNAYDDTAWQQLDLPHDWAVAGPF